MKDKRFEINDIVLPSLELPDPCPIKIEIRDGSIYLYVGQRDFQWDLKDEEFVGCGTRRG